MSKPATAKKSQNKDLEALHVCVGFSCNNSCVFCMERGNHESEMTRDFCRERVYEVLSMNQGKKKILFTKDEPTLNPELMDYITYAREHGNRDIAIISNGRRFSDMRYCLKLVQAGVREFTVSIHGHNEKIHDALTRSAGSFAQTAQGLKNLSRLKESLPITIHISHVVNKLNYKFLDKFFVFIQQYFIDEIALNTVQPRGNNMEKDFSALMPRYRDVAGVMEIIYEKRAALLKSRASAWNVKIIDMPLCVSQKLFPLMGVCEQTLLADSKELRAWTITSLKKKHKPCSLCDYDSLCEGVFSNYVKHFGWDEFVPVKK